MRGAPHHISIHALLAESDGSKECGGGSASNFNPRSPCGERRLRWHRQLHLPGISIHALLAESDHLWAFAECAIFRFQSTLSLRRATFAIRRVCYGNRNFNPRSPCGERQQIPPNWPYRFCLKCQFKDGEKSKKAKGSASAQASSPAYEKNKVRIPWGDFECFRFAPIK